MLPEFAEWLVPPAGASAEEQRDWQWRISMIVLAQGVLTGFLIAAALGQVIGISGFASATEVAAAQQTLNEVRLDQIRNRIDQKRLQQCQAIMESNGRAMQATYEQMQSLVNQHYSMAGFQYRVPDCGELIPYATAAIPAPTPVPTVPAGKP